MELRQKILPVGILLLTIIGFLAGTTRAIYQADLVQGSTDIYPTWKAGQLFWEEGISPYADTVGEQSQETIYGRPAEANEDEFHYVYPFYSFLYLGPLVLLEFKLAAAIFMNFLLVLLLLSLVLTLDMLKWLPKPALLGIVILFVLLSYFSIRGLLLGQPAFLAYGFHIVAYWGLARGKNRLAGIMLALSTIKPQTGYLIVPLLLLWAWTNHRRVMVYSFLTMFAILFVASFVLMPSWLMEWIDRVTGYQGYTETLPTVHIVTHVIESVPSAITTTAQIILSILILIPVLQFWRRAIFDGENQQFLWGVMLTMAASLLIAPRVATTYYVELYPAILVGMMLWERQRKLSYLVIGVVGFTIGYWLLHVVTVPEESGREAAIVYVVFPTLVYLWLVWKRQAWEGLIF